MEQPKLRVGRIYLEEHKEFLDKHFTEFPNHKIENVWYPAPNMNLTEDQITEFWQKFKADNIDFAMETRHFPTFFTCCYNYYKRPQEVCDPFNIIRMANKATMRDLFGQSKFTPQWWDNFVISDSLEVVKRRIRKFPCIIKPTLMSAAAHIVVCNDMNDVEKAYASY